MSFFVFDTSGNQDLLTTGNIARPKYEDTKKSKLLEENKKIGIGDLAADLRRDNKEEQKYDYFGLPPPSVDISNIIEDTLSITRKTPSKVEQEMDHALQMADDAFAQKDKPKKNKMKHMVDLDHSDFNEITGKRDEEQTFKTNIENELRNSDMVTNLEQLKELPSITKKKQRELNRIERSKTKGKGWFNMPATELTEERENDLKILQMRSVLDPKHFYKKNDLKVLPKYFQIGTVQHSPLDYYNERDMRRNKKRTLVDELLADAETQKYIKRKHKEIMITKQKYTQRKAMKKMKKLKKNK